MFNENIKIEKGIEPPKNLSVKNRVKYDWDSIEVGDSFIFEKSKQSSVIGSFRNWQSKDKARLKFRLRSFTISEDQVRFFFEEKE